MDGEILVLQHSRTDPAGLFGEVLHQRGLHARVVRADCEPLPGAAGWAAVLVLGGPQSVAAPPPWLMAERMLVRQMVEAGVPTLGMCLGGQILAAAFGARVRPAGGTRYGFGTLRLNAAGQADPLFAGLSRELLTFRWNGEQFDLPSEATRLDEDTSPAAAFRIGRAGYGMQFHWELTPQMLAEWQTRAPAAEPGETPVPAELVSRAATEAPTKYPRYREGAKAVFGNFLDLAFLAPAGARHLADAGQDAENGRESRE